MRYGLGLFLVVVLFFGCKKDKNDNTVDITGTVKDATSSGPISGATVRLYYRPLQNGVYSTNYTLFKSASTASDGTYSMTFDKPVTSDFKFVLDAANCFPAEIIKNPDLISESETNTIDITAYSSCSIQLHVKNASPVDGSDQIVFKYLGFNYTCSSCCSTTDQVFTGTAVDETISCMHYANMYVKYQYIVTKSGSSNLFIDSVYCAKGATVPIEILY